MSFSTSFVYEAIDKITPVLQKLEQEAKKVEKAQTDAFKKPEKAASNFLKKLGKVGKKLQGIGKEMTTKVTAPIVAGFSAGILFGGKYEDALASLSAITGLQGQRLNELSSEILKTSNQFGLASTDIAKGMELIGSKQPALLKTPKILMDVTRSAATLAKASGQDLATAGSDLLDVMNTFNLSGEKATQTINLLAAASKFGSAQVPFVTAAMKNAGAQAKLSKVSLAQTVAAIEIMSEKTGLAAEVIGTGLQSALRQLEMGSKKTRPSVVGLQVALERLNAKGLDTKEMAELVGAEGVKSFSALIANADAFKTMTKNIQGTNIATEQAKIRMATFNQTVLKLWQTVKNKMIDIFMENKDAIGQFAMSGLRAVQMVVRFLNNNRELTMTLVKLAAAIAAVGPIMVTVGTGLLAFAKLAGGAKIAMIALAGAFGPWGAIAIAVTGVAVALKKVYDVANLLSDNDTITGLAMMWGELTGGPTDPELYLDKATGPTKEAMLAKKNIEAMKFNRAQQGMNVSVSGNIGVESKSVDVKQQNISVQATPIGSNGGGQ